MRVAEVKCDCGHMHKTLVCVCGQRQTKDVCEFCECIEFQEYIPEITPVGVSVH